MSNTLHILQDKIIVNYGYFLAQTQATDILLMVQASLLLFALSTYYAQSTPKDTKMNPFSVSNLK